MTFRFPGFEPEARAFLRALGENNHRPWFQARKARYERYVRRPMLQLVGELGMALAEHSPGHLQDAHKSVYRIYRDVRFTRDKSPYKTHAAAVFPRVGLPRHACGGFYFHFSADELLVGGGLYAPGPLELSRIRRQIAEDPDELRSLLAEPEFRQRFGDLDGKRLKRSPVGYRRDHPANDLLVYKQFLAGAKLPAESVEKVSIGPVIDHLFRTIAPLIGYLNRPLDPA